MVDVGRYKNVMYEVEHKPKLYQYMAYYIKRVGWPHKRSSWQTRNMFGNISDALKKFYDRERAVSIVIRYEQQWPQCHNYIVLYGGKMKLILFCEQMNSRSCISITMLIIQGVNGISRL
ncbi:unnamed protein product, partial [Cercopithifilaria johnstoni]